MCLDVTVAILEWTRPSGIALRSGGREPTRERLQRARPEFPLPRPGRHGDAVTPTRRPCSGSARVARALRSGGRAAPDAASIAARWGIQSGCSWPSTRRAIARTVRAQASARTPACGRAGADPVQEMGGGHRRADEPLDLPQDWRERARYRSMFDSTAVAIWEEDFSRVRPVIEELRAAGGARFPRVLHHAPDFVRQLADMGRYVDVNDTSLRMFGQEQTELLDSLKKISAPETRAAFVESLVAIAEGRGAIEAETVVSDAHGERLTVLFTSRCPRRRLLRQRAGDSSRHHGAHARGVPHARRLRHLP